MGVRVHGCRRVELYMSIYEACMRPCMRLCVYIYDRMCIKVLIIFVCLYACRSV